MYTTENSIYHWQINNNIETSINTRYINTLLIHQYTLQIHQYILLIHQYTTLLPGRPVHCTINQTSELLWEAFSHAAINAWWLFVHISSWMNCSIACTRLWHSGTTWQSNILATVLHKIKWKLIPNTELRKQTCRNTPDLSATVGNFHHYIWLESWYWWDFENMFLYWKLRSDVFSKI